MVSAEVLAEYRARIEREFKLDPLHRFIQGLRNYALHYDVPITFPSMGGSVHNGTPGGDWKQGLCLDLDELARWDGWNELARQFLEQHGKSVYLAELVEIYGQKVRSLHGWLLQRDRQDRLARCPFILRANVNEDV